MNLRTGTGTGKDWKIPPLPPLPPLPPPPQLHPPYNTRDIKCPRYACERSSLSAEADCHQRPPEKTQNASLDASTDASTGAPMDASIRQASGTPTPKPLRHVLPVDCPPPPTRKSTRARTTTKPCEAASARSAARMRSWSVADTSCEPSGTAYTPDEGLVKFPCTPPPVFP